MACRVLVESNVETELGDGIVLRSTVYRPAVEGERFPVLLMRSPYGDRTADSAYFNPIQVASNGFVVIVQDVRGRFGSDGHFTPSEHEADDGAAAVEWAASLPYSTGKVGMWGRSYRAEAQWRAARRRPHGLAALALGVSAGGSADHGAVFRGGAFELGSRLSWGHASISLEEIRRECNNDAARMARELESWARLDAAFADGTAFGTLPLADLKSEFSTFMQSVVLPSAGEDPGGELSQAWDWASAVPVELPTLHIGGWFDIFLPNTLGQYHRQREAARDNPSVPRPRLILGPWSHSNLTGRFPDCAFGALASAAAIGSHGDLSTIHTEWFRHVLADGPEPQAPPVLVYVMGENQWRAFEELPEPTGRIELFLGAAGTLAPEPHSDSHASYAYDPLNPVPTAGGATMNLGADLPGPAEQSAVEARDDVLTFTTAPLTEPVTVFGQIGVHLFASSSAVDTDFVARLCRVTPDGRSLGIADGIVRASWRDACAGDGIFRAGTPRRPLVPGKIEQFDVNLWSTACTFSLGDRIRVQVTSSCHPRWDRNLNTGAKAYDSSDTAIAHQRIHLGPSTPSRISLEVLATP